MQTILVRTSLGGALLFGLVLSAPVSAQTHYSVTELRPTPDAMYTYPMAINNKGQVVGDADGAAFIYENGKFIDLVPFVGSPANVRGINDAGVVTGEYQQGSGSGTYLYVNGAVVDIPYPPAEVPLGGYVDAINKSNEITIHELAYDPDHPDLKLAYIYRLASDEFVPLGSLGGDHARAYDINDRGQAVGESSLSKKGIAHAFLYGESKMVDLGTLGGRNSRATGINNVGHIVGTSSIDDSDASHAFLYNPDATTPNKMIDLGVLQGTRSYANAINEADQVVGSSDVNRETHAFIYTDGRMWDLNLLIDPTDPHAVKVVLVSGYDINDQGWIVAGGYERRDRRSRAYLLRPLPSKTNQP